MIITIIKRKNLYPTVWIVQSRLTTTHTRSLAMLARRTIVLKEGESKTAFLKTHIYAFTIGE